jgi:hypothetical protein
MLPVNFRVAHMLTVIVSETGDCGDQGSALRGLMTEAVLDFDRLLKLRLVVALVGEMDLAKWWNTNGHLGRLGAVAIRRGFPFDNARDSASEEEDS